ncbi:MAG: HRDC domain-containing protein [Pseudomonadota bacterium]
MIEHVITQPAELDRLCSQLRGSLWLALDTEFIRDRTYYPQLCLLQISNATHAACIDLQQLPHPESLLALIYDPGITKVWHASRQDLEIFQHCWKYIPTPFFDTQMAAELLGYGQQLSYAHLVQTVLGTTLDKDQSRTDWAARPLSAYQVRYALDDVVYLGKLYTRLSAALSPEQTRQLAQRQAPLHQAETYFPPPDEMWRRVKGRNRLRAGARRRLKRLAAWREVQARRHDVPRQWLLTDQALCKVCRLDAVDEQMNYLDHHLKNSSDPRMQHVILPAPESLT